MLAEKPLLYTVRKVIGLQDAFIHHLHFHSCVKKSAYYPSGPSGRRLYRFL